MNLFLDELVRDTRVITLCLLTACVAFPMGFLIGMLVGATLL